MIKNGRPEPGRTQRTVNSGMGKGLGGGEKDKRAGDSAQTEVLEKGAVRHQLTKKGGRWSELVRRRKKKSEHNGGEKL